MNLHEYQSKQLFAKYGIPVPNGFVASNGAEAAEATRKLGGSKWVVKAQVHAALSWWIRRKRLAKQRPR
jgi:succinyl-CoA synthetase beta subunit